MDTVRLALCMPAYNESSGIVDTLQETLDAIEKTPQVAELHLILADDASTDGTAAIAAEWIKRLSPSAKPMALHTLTLLRNQGHQRALLCAIRHAVTLPVDAILVMDADGQDNPQAIRSMVELLGQTDIVFALRSKRAEGWIWVMGYRIFQWFSRWVLGQTLNFGNFCMFGPSVARVLAAQGDLTHLAATLSALPFRHASLPVPRRRRKHGQTKMSFSRLIDYAVASMTASSHLWIRFFSRLSLIAALLSALGVITVIGIRLFTPLAIAGWASVMAMLGFVISFQSLGFLVILSALKQQMFQITPVMLPMAVKPLIHERAHHRKITPSRAG